MTIRNNPFAALAGLGRRRFLAGSGALLSAGTVAMLAGRPALAAAQRVRQDGDAQSDIRILNTALGAELEAIAAYALGAGSGLLLKPTLELAVQFQGQHREHADVLARTVRKLGGTPVEARARYEFPAEQLRNQNDVLSFAAALERGAVSAYLGAVPLFHERELARAAASILGDEAMHWAILRHALGENPVPEAFVS